MPQACSLEVPKTTSSYDDADGYEAGAMPQLDASALSSEDEAAPDFGGATSCPLPPVRPPADIEAQL